MTIEEIREESQKELMRRSDNIKEFFDGKRNLIRAFSWCFTPQNFNFWNRLHELGKEDEARLELAKTLVELGLEHMVPDWYKVEKIPEDLLWE